MGIEGLFHHSEFSKSCDVIASISDLERCGGYLKAFPVVDIMVLTLSSLVKKPTYTLRLLGEDILRYHPNSKVLLIVDVMFIGGMTRYLLGLKNTKAVLDVSASLEILQNQLLNFFQPCMELDTSNHNTERSLSLREMNVLRRLLEGQSSTSIARDLQLSPKTISHYKRSALIKLGIRSLQPLMINDHSKKIMSGELESLITESNQVGKYISTLPVSKLIRINSISSVDCIITSNSYCNVS